MTDPDAEDEPHLPGTDVVLSGRDLNYCPLHGEELDTTGPRVTCPTCGAVNVDFWRTPWEGAE